MLSVVDCKKRAERCEFLPPITNTAAARLEVSSTNRELPCSRSYSALVNSAMLIDTCLVCCFTVTLHRPKYSVLHMIAWLVSPRQSQVSISPLPSNSLPNLLNGHPLVRLSRLQQSVLSMTFAFASEELSRHKQELPTATTTDAQLHPLFRVKNLLPMMFLQ